MIFAYEFAQEKDLEAALEKLRSHYGVTGEFHIKPLEGRGWRLTVHSEKNLRESSLATLPGRRVDVAG